MLRYREPVMTGREIAGGRRGRNVEIIECGAGGDCDIQLESPHTMMMQTTRGTSESPCLRIDQHDLSYARGRTHFEDEKAGRLEDELERGKRPKDRLSLLAVIMTGNQL
jgi:hypothetical protein